MHDLAFLLLNIISSFCCFNPQGHSVFVLYYKCFVLTRSPSGLSLINAIPTFYWLVAWMHTVMDTALAVLWGFACSCPLQKLITFIHKDWHFYCIFINIILYNPVFCLILLFLLFWEFLLFLNSILCLKLTTFIVRHECFCLLLYLLVFFDPLPNWFLTGAVCGLRIKNACVA